MKTGIFTVIAFMIVGCLYSQNLPSFNLQARFGVQSDLPNSEFDFGGGIGGTVEFASSTNPWQIGLYADKFSNQDLSELNYHGYKRWSAMISAGKMWKTGLRIDKKPLRIGGGILLISTLHLRAAPGGDYATVSAPSFGVYTRIDYPLLEIGNAEVLLFTDHSLFGEGFMRNLLGLSYPLGKKRD
jgi:hypothetical protein